MAVAYVGSIQDDPSLGSVRLETAPDLDGDERAYVEYVVPRLDRLIEEGSVVSGLVAERSRNLLALNARGTRIRTLCGQLVSPGTAVPVPARFTASHADLVAAAEGMNAAIDDAEGMLATFDFDGMAEVVPRFEGALDTMRRVRDALPAASGVHISRTLFAWEARHAGVGARTRAGAAGAAGAPDADRGRAYEV
jgi:hypothetical protein